MAVDIGGTFTDVVLTGGDDDRILTAKKLTTGDPLGGVRAGVEAVLADAGLEPGALREPIVHATTLVTNALIADRAAPVAFVTTEGFGDVFEIRTEHRYDIYDVQIEFAPPPVPRERIFELAERTLADGRVLGEPAQDDLERLATAVGSSGAEAVAIGLLHSYAEPANERRVASFLQERLDVPVCTSSDVAGLVREYPRFVTTAANAATMPILGPYLARLEGWLREEGIPASVLIMLSNGGAVGAGVAARYPVRAVESGPAAGALAGTHFARTHAPGQMLCFDMGGTTAKACILQDAEPEIATDFEYGRRYRFIAGSGLPLKTPSVDLIEIGAGGGSIARRDEFGLLAVGPRSAGAEPGPASYGRGGEDPTVTDADLLLGYLDAEGFAGGKMPLDRGAAERAVGALAADLGMSGDELAAGIHDLANQSMAAAAARHATERGLDLRGTALLAFGGAGPVHACGVAELLEAPKVIFPPLASVLSAFGCLVSPLRIDLARTRLEALDALDQDDLEAVCEEMRAEGRALLGDSGLDAGAVRFRYGVDARYRGQATEVTVWLGEGPQFPVSVSEVLGAFEERYAAMFGLTIPDVPAEVVTWRIAAFGPAPTLPQTAVDDDGERRGARERPVRFAVHDEPVIATVHQRAALAPGDAIAGPAVIEEPDTTIVIRPGWQATVAEDRSIVAHVD
jgi:N-methylhydantoinase A